MIHQTTAMVFVLSHRLLADADVCIQYCREQGYVLAGVVRDDWHRACSYLWGGECDVLVVADARTLDPDRAPRVEVVAHHASRPERPDVPTGHRASRRRAKNQREVGRTQIVRRNAAG